MGHAKHTEEADSLYERILRKNYGNYREIVEATYQYRVHLPSGEEELAEEEDDLRAAEPA